MKDGEDLCLAETLTKIKHDKVEWVRNWSKNIIKAIA